MATPWPRPETVCDTTRGTSAAEADTVAEADAEDVSDPALPQTQDCLRAVVSSYRPGLPQVWRQPGITWFIARLVTGDFAAVGESTKALVRACHPRADGQLEPGPGADAPGELLAAEGDTGQVRGDPYF